MRTRLILIFLLLTCGRSFSQVFCDSLVFDTNGLATLHGKPYSGHCFSVTKKHLIRRHLVHGCFDSIVFMDKKLRLQTVETVTKCSDISCYKSFYKNGSPRKMIEMKNGDLFGCYREYYENGKLKYEAEYGDSTLLINDTYYTWDKKGQKYMHAYVETVREKRRGKLIFHSSYERRKKIKVSNDEGE